MKSFRGLLPVFLGIAAACAIALIVIAGAAAPPPQSSKSVTISLLSTTDVHGHIEPWDYYADKPADLGLAKIATLVKQVRAGAPHALLLDCGDTIQGTPLADYFAEKDASRPNPIIAAFNAMHYDAMAVGNHEFNFGLATLWKAMDESRFPWLAANVRQTDSHGARPFRSYIIKEVDGVRIGIVGFVTPGIPRWEIPEHYTGYEFEQIVDAARRVIPEVRSKVDLLIVLMHSGLGPDLFATTEGRSEEISGENAALALADQVPGIDLIFFGHTHRELSETFVNGALLTQAKNWGQSLARADVVMSRDESGCWRVKSKHSRTIPVTPDVPADAEIMRIAEPYHQITEKYLGTEIAVSDREMTGQYARYEDSPLVDLIHAVQLDAGHADVSMATMFYTHTRIPAGPVTIRHADSLYVYENMLYVVEMTGAQLKDALEHAASFFPGWPALAGQKLQLPGYNADSAAGVSYVVDLTQPVGQRIRDLQFRGQPLDPGKKLRVAINNYRYTGGGGYQVYKGLPIVYRSSEEIRELLIQYLKRTKKFPADASGNWKVIPPEALDAIKKAADANSRDQSR
jgi:2',3'-cyclic-nucleotide 2'-phosphodiesterase/3'-nucleotidase